MVARSPYCFRVPCVPDVPILVESSDIPVAPVLNVIRRPGLLNSVCVLYVSKHSNISVPPIHWGGAWFLQNTDDADIADCSVHTIHTEHQQHRNVQNDRRHPCVPVVGMIRPPLHSQCVRNTENIQYTQNIRNFSNMRTFGTTDLSVCPSYRDCSTPPHIQYIRNTQNTQYTQNIQKYSEPDWFEGSEYSVPSHREGLRNSCLCVVLNVQVFRVYRITQTVWEWKTLEALLVLAVLAGDVLDELFPVL